MLSPLKPQSRAQGRVETGRNPAEPQDNAVGGAWGQRPGRWRRKRWERQECPQDTGPCPAWHALQGEQQRGARRRDRELKVCLLYFLLC